MKLNLLLGVSIMVLASCNSKNEEKMEKKVNALLVSVKKNQLDK